MKNTFNFTLIEFAAKKGDDRYATILGDREWTVYFPQEITRPNGYPVQDITIEVRVGGIKIWFI